MGHIFLIKLLDVGDKLHLIFDLYFYFLLDFLKFIRAYRQDVNRLLSLDVDLGAAHRAEDLGDVPAQIVKELLDVDLSVACLALVRLLGLDGDGGRLAFQIV